MIINYNTRPNHALTFMFIITLYYNAILMTIGFYKYWKLFCVSRHSGGLSTRKSSQGRGPYNGY